MIRETNAQRHVPAQLGMNVLSFPMRPFPPATTAFTNAVNETDALIVKVAVSSAIEVKDLREQARKRLGL